MAEISKITLPNGDTYDIKDAAARENVDHGNARIFSADCSTAAATQRKDVTITECTELIAGDVFVITFTNAQTYNGTPTMQINSLGAKNIRRLTGANAGRYEWNAGEVVVFKWTGTYFVIATGGFATTTYFGRTKLYTGADSSFAGYALTPKSLYDMANHSICPYYSTSETYAVGDKVRYSNYIYECITEITTAEAWTAAHWQIAPTLQEQVTTLDGNVAAVQDGLAIVANGNTHASVAAGQFVYVRNHSTLAEGLYKASSAIGTNAALSTSNLTADGSGGLNDLQEQVTSLISNIGSLIVSEGRKFSNSASISVGSVKRFEIPIEKTGYTPIGIAWIEGSNTTGLVLQEYLVKDTKDYAWIYYRNASNAAITPSSITVWVLYVKNTA